jgi:DNA-nicking Smr family endonuclease
MPIGDELDLHAFAPRDVVSVVEEYLAACRTRGILTVRVVHGRGKGVQRAEVRRLLAHLPGVASFADAPPQSGGWGATIVRLEPQPES